VAGLVQNGSVMAHVNHPQSGGEWVTLPELVDEG
jgi:hypothetical protein